MNNIINIEYPSVTTFLGEKSLSDSLDRALSALKKLNGRMGEGSEFLGWMDLPSSLEEDVIINIENIAKEWKEKCEVVVVIGIGGSYLGAKSALEARSNPFRNFMDRGLSPQILFAGQNMSEDYLSELLELLDNKNYGIVVISKSGTTTEPAVAFRILKTHIEKKYGKSESSSRIIAITDKSKGALRRLSEIEGYRSFVIPDDVGGRFSVLTPVGLLPIAIAGFNIRELLNGANNANSYTSSSDRNNPALQYAAVRNALYQKGKKIEIVVNYNPKLQYFAEWWKQLYGESEGKDGKGIFPASVNFTTDLHSMGQYIQDG